MLIDLYFKTNFVTQIKIKTILIKQISYFFKPFTYL